MDEVDGQAVERRAELRDSAQRRLAAPPVVARAPIIDQRTHLRERHVLRPIIDRLALGPARVRQPLFQVVERGLRSAIPEPADSASALCRCGRRLKLKFLPFYSH